MTETHRGACPLDCPDNCSLAVQTEGGRVTVVDGSELSPVTAGYICAKVRRFPEAMYGRERVLSPLVRAGAKGEAAFRETSWDEALTLVTHRLSEARDTHGGESILPFYYGGSNGFLSQDTTDARLFRRLGASQLARTVCAAPTGRAADGLYGKFPGVGYTDYVHANLIVVWGANPVDSGIHLMPYIQEAQKRGAKLVVIDPRRTKLAVRSDLHLAPFPGTDLPLALAIINLFFERGWADESFLNEHASGVQALRERAAPWNVHYAASVCRMTDAEIERFAELYAAVSPAVLRCGWGLERNRNGGSAVAAVLALPAVAGKFGVRGGGYTLSNSKAWGLSGADAANAPMPATRTINMNLLGETLLSADLAPPVKALFVYNCNPLATMPNQEAVRRGLAREDLFTVVFDPFLTDTARYADVVLPATTFLERRELSRGYGSFTLQDAPAVVPPVGAARTNHEVFLDLVQRLGLDQPGDPTTEEDVREAVLSRLDAEGGSVAARRGLPDRDAARRALDETGLVLPAYGTGPVQFVDVFPWTSDGKIHLVPEDLDREAPEGLYHYRHEPRESRHLLALISPSSNRTISSTLGQLYRKPATLEIHPADALVRRIQDGDPVRVFNEYGEVRCAARINADVRLGVVELAKGLWSHNTLNGATANALAPDTLTDLGAGACFNDARVQVERLTAPV
jgi:anaerobic selenocysteine-containing dehydrogenase